MPAPGKYPHVSIPDYTTEPWHPENLLHFDRVRVGVRYAFESPEDALECLGLGTAVFAWCAMRAHTRWTVDDSRWSLWDLQTWDGRRGCEVGARPWPWCWGDRFWAALVRDELMVFLRLDIEDGSELFIPPLVLGRDRRLRALWSWARRDARVYVQGLAPGFLNPRIQLGPTGADPCVEAVQALSLIEPRSKSKLRKHP